MSDTLKSAGAACPKCHIGCPAEYTMQGQNPHWKCLNCGAEGELTGERPRKAVVAPPPAAPPVKQPPPWVSRNLTKG